MRGRWIWIVVVLGMIGANVGRASENGQRAYLVVTGSECLKVDLSKVELWVPMVDGKPDTKHSEIRHIFATYDPNCGVYRVGRVSDK